MQVNSERSEDQKEQNHSNKLFEETENNIGLQILSMGVNLPRPETFTTTRCNAR